MSVPAIEPGGFTPYVPPTLAPTAGDRATSVSGTAGASGVSGVSGTSATTAADAPAGPSFGDMLAGGLDRLQTVNDRADQLAVQAATGDLSSLHDYTIAATEASVTTQLTAAVRNKALEAFTEIMRMSI